MKMVFISNYFNHHQQPFSEAMYRLIGDDYSFIETVYMPQARVKLGYQRDDLPSYVIPVEYTLSFFDKVLEIINEADVVIAGESEAKYIAERKKQKKLIIKYSERLLKKGFSPVKYIPQRIKLHRQHKGKNMYLLCAGSYTARDYAKFGLYKNKAFKWGYFPPTKVYEDVDSLIENKEQNSIIWAGRFVEWKHPEACVEVAKRLKQDGYEFTIYMAGAGKKKYVGELARSYGVYEHFKALGALSPDGVREKMEKFQVFLLTSDRREGWGAVLNEAMNSACAIVASDAAGSTGYLVKNEENGIIYESGNVEQLYKSVKSIFDDNEKRKRLSKKAYETIMEEWNAELSAQRLMQLIDGLLNGKELDLFSEGPCSRA